MAWKIVNTQDMLYPLNYRNQISPKSVNKNGRHGTNSFMLVTIVVTKSIFMKLVPSKWHVMNPNA